MSFSFPVIIGFVATSVSVLGFLPQVAQAWRTKRTRDISLSAYLLLQTSAILWLSYGIFRADAMIIAANAIIGLLVFFMIVLKLRYH